MLSQLDMLTRLTLAQIEYHEKMIYEFKKKMDICMKGNAEDTKNERIIIETKSPTIENTELTHKMHITQNSDLYKMKKDELKALCKELKIKGITGKSKEELIEMIMQRDTAPVSAPKNKAETDVKVEQEMSVVDKVCEFIGTNTDKRIVLLRNREVIMWLFGDLSFLPPIEKKNKSSDNAKYKVLEDKWGQDTLKTRRPDLKLDKQWTNNFGQHICEELYILMGKEVWKPDKKEHYQPDSEVDDSILEAKAGTFYTGGTAGEKILGCPFKYAEIPDLYSKPLKILCMGGAERVCREQYGNLAGSKCSIQKKRFLDFFKDNQIEYVGATDILKSLVSS